MKIKANMDFELSGKLIEKQPVTQVSSKFQKREFVIEVNKQLPSTTITDYIKFQLVQDKCSLIDNFELGDDLNVKFNIRGNRWEKNGQVSYFTNLDAWKIDRAGGSQQQNVAPQYSNDDIPPPPPDDDDIPF